MRLILLLALLPSWAGAQSLQCAEHAAMARHLAEGWGEARQSIGLDSGDSVVETWANAATGTWTLTLTRPGGPTCMVASGYAWEAVEEAPVVLDDPA